MLKYLQYPQQPHTIPIWNIKYYFQTIEFALAIGGMKIKRGYYEDFVCLHLLMLEAQLVSKTLSFMFIVP